MTAYYLMRDNSGMYTDCRTCCQQPHYQRLSWHRTHTNWKADTFFWSPCKIWLLFLILRAHTQEVLKLGTLRPVHF